MRIDESGPPSAVAKISNELNKMVSTAIQAAAVAAGKAGAKDRGVEGTDRFSATYAAAVGCVSAIHVLASMLGHHGDIDRPKVEIKDISKLINPTSTLLAALLVHGMCPETTFEGITAQGEHEGVAVGQNIEFGNGVILDAIQQVERITGRPVDGFIHPDMLASVRETAKNADEPMNKFLAQRRPTPGSLH